MLAPHPDYYTLVGSLPALPYFERARNLPISGPQFDTRLALLAPPHRAALRVAEQLLDWRQLPVSRSDAQIAELYESLMQKQSNPTLRAAVESRMTLRTILAALRRRGRGAMQPPRGIVWGVGPLVAHIERHWSAPDFGLEPLFPWVPQARRLLEAGASLGLQHLLITLVWRDLERLGAWHYFDFDAVVVYRFKWDLLERWLGHSAERAATRFDQLVSEGLGAHASLVN